MKNKYPIITYKKWWHRFIPKYRRCIRMMNLLLEREMKNSLEEKIAKARVDAILYGVGYVGK